MDQRVKVPATRLDDLSLNPGPHMERSCSFKLSSNLTHVLWHMYTTQRESVSGEREGEIKMLKKKFSIFYGLLCGLYIWNYKWRIYLYFSNYSCRLTTASCIAKAKTPQKKSELAPVSNEHIVLYPDSLSWTRDSNRHISESIFSLF